MIDVVFTERHNASSETKDVINDQKLSACGPRLRPAAAKPSLSVSPAKVSLWNQGARIAPRTSSASPVRLQHLPGAKPTARTSDEAGRRQLSGLAG